MSDDIKIEKASNVKSEFIKAIVYGKTSTQKTRWACNGIKNAIVLDLENGLSSTEDIDGLSRINVSSAYDFSKAIDYISQHEDEYDTLIIDSFSAYGEMLFLALSDMYPDKKDGMINCKNKRCEEEDCNVRPNFGSEFGSQYAKYCSEHKLDGMFAQAGINYMLGINIAF